MLDIVAGFGWIILLCLVAVAVVLLRGRQR